MVSAALASSSRNAKPVTTPKRASNTIELDEGQKPGGQHALFDRDHAQLIPKAAIDKIPILSMAYGLSASADGNNFPWVFNPPATYWDGASAFVRHAAEVEGGFDKLKGKTIGLVHLDAPYGKEPIPLFEALAKDYGFALKLYPVPGSQMQNQTSLRLDVRRDRPDWIYLQGWGAMNPTALKEASKIGFPMNRLVGVWWAGGEDDARPAGELRQRLLFAEFQWRRPELLGNSRHPQIRGRQGQEPSRVQGPGRREPLQPRRNECGSHNRRKSVRPSD